MLGLIHKDLFIHTYTENIALVLQILFGHAHKHIKDI